VHWRDSFGHINSFKAALAVAKARLTLERQQTLKVLPRILTPEQTTVELGEGVWLMCSLPSPQGRFIWYWLDLGQD
jgi:hypothetical protein